MEFLDWEAQAAGTLGCRGKLNTANTSLCILAIFRKLLRIPSLIQTAHCGVLASLFMALTGVDL